MWLALITDKTLTIKVDDPDTMRSNEGTSMFSSQDMMPKPKAAVAGGVNVVGSNKKVAPSDIDESGGQLLEGAVKNSDLIIQPGGNTSKESINSQPENSDDDSEFLDEE